MRDALLYSELHVVTLEVSPVCVVSSVISAYVESD